MPKIAQNIHPHQFHEQQLMWLTLTLIMGIDVGCRELPWPTLVGLFSAITCSLDGWWQL